MGQSAVQSWKTQNIERTEDLLGHGVRISLVKGTSLVGLIASCVPTTSHAVVCAMLAFVDKDIVLEGAVHFGLSIFRSPVWSAIGQRTYV